MADWEDEDVNQEENKEQQNQVNFNDFDDESEVIPEEKKKNVETINKREKDEINYEKKYQERKKKDIAIMKEIEESVKNIQDPELRLKKKLELMELKRVEKFIGTDNDNDQKQDQKDVQEVDLDFELKTEKDYINLAQKSAVKINQANKSNESVYEFLKASIEILLPTLDSDTIEKVKTAMIFLKNKKEKKGEKKKKGNEEEKKEVVPKSDRYEERKALYKQYGDGDISQQKPEGEDDYNDDGDFM
jgi:hypothetical protein